MNILTLNSGFVIPLVGTGTNTFGKENHQFTGVINNTTEEIENALHSGYTLVDTAIAYRNEAVVSMAIKKAGIDRSGLFLTSKIPAAVEYTQSDKQIEDAIDSSLKALDTDYIDLYLLHFPLEKDEDNVRVWKVLERYAEQGILKSIGVSNFNIEQLSYLIDHSTIKPAVNQIQSHPGLWQDELIDFCQSQQVAVEAWGPISKVSDDAKQKLSVIGEKYHKTWVQVILRYQIERNVIVIPKSHDKERQQQNLAIFDFSLSVDDKSLIRTL